MKLYLRLIVLTLAWAPSVLSAQEMFLGGDEFVLARERSSSERELQVFYPYGEDERDWEKRIEIHYYPDLEQPRRVVMAVMKRLRERYPDLIYKILPQPESDRAGVSYLVATEGETEVRLEFLLYAENPGVRGLMAYRLTYRSRGPDARYAKALLRGKWDYYERAFVEANWPESLENVGKVTSPSVFTMGGSSFGKSMSEVVPVENRSLTVRLPEGRMLEVDRAFLESQNIKTRIPFFYFAVPKDTENLFIEYQSAGIPEVLKLSLAGAEMQLVENIRIFPFILPSSSGNERLWETAGKLRRKIEEEYLNGWDDVRVSEPFLTQIGPAQGFVCLASFADSEGIRMFARFTLLMPPLGDRGILAFSQVDPRYSSVKRLEDLESGGVMAGVAHSIRFIDPATRVVEEEPEASQKSSPLPYESN
ncbi:hypothetical protein [Puniceicoccus vermicola]|uniref:Uncharacterized protein n=1 Tax=Puniceicoccus vermicola TaxID=388746 RepID=A0A7X1E5N1_9BACT|nr:hypothetical protein [Puniceicoccus vermicola]MBC2601777.1 hypothetical protein [Puniceicoccus vermicola]